MRIALLEVSHWHFPLYQQALHRPDVEIVAVSDRDAGCREAVAADFGAPAFADWRDALRLEGIDFAFAFGRHREMPAIAEALISRGIPFAMEKPCGTKAEDVARLRALAEARGLYVAVPLILRVSPLLETLRRAEAGDAVRYTHLAFRFIAGPPARYLQNSPWMLDPAVSGGGSTINLAVHFIDLVRELTGSDAKAVFGLMNNFSYGTDVEDYSQFSMRMADGTPALIETGYAFPMTATEKREFSITIGTTHGYFRTTDAGLTEYSRATGECVTHPIELDTDGLYADFVGRALDDWRTGAAPIAGLADVEAVMRVVDAAYASNAEGRSLDLA
ncbi:Gfo/Idh/MocA family protein [Rhodobium gokarnense]|uniref:Dehydrogenase n=1 Tax=Rhodobium gokarnense TaxID=364296 RepID=A0ABT3HAC1_9HYPH|nr:Gfo/Idh/MocA family oxidoreductase [Rhodobium gokarnense]MCW2307352.1 putative dehydrogenase [Rhodobium gokarnense]